MVSVFPSRYETPTLRALCEVLLVSRVEDSTVFWLLEVADRYSARQLRVRTHTLITARLAGLHTSQLPNPNEHLPTVCRRPPCTTSWAPRV